jgi:nitroreductase
MLAAHAEGLGSCVIGFAVDALNTSKWKSRLGIPQNAQAIAPIILGKPTGNPPSVSRNPLTIYSWKALALN